MVKKIKHLIDTTNQPITVIQILGFIFLVMGILFLIGRMIYFMVSASDADMPGSEVAIAFFIIMLGFSFVFPDMLQDQTGGLSTMRVVVFMMVNVICILMLKSGWNAKSLGEIKIDPYLMGVIAFVFGSKATQTYFESKLAVPPTPPTPPQPASMAATAKPAETGAINKKP